MDIDVRFSNGSAVRARAQFETANGTAIFDIESGVATLSDLDVPTGQANGTINLQKFNQLTNEIENAKTNVGQLSFISSVE